MHCIYFQNQLWLNAIETRVSSLFAKNGVIFLRVKIGVPTIIRAMSSDRPSKDEYYLEIAKAIGLRSPCLRKKFGAIIVKNDSVVATGYNGPPRGGVNCFDIGCVREELDMEHYAAYDATCPAVHAEENAIVNAARNGVKVIDGVLYIQGVSPDDNSLVESRPCHRCRRALINAGITQVVTRDTEGGVIKYTVSDWIHEDTEEYIKKYNEAKKG